MVADECRITLEGNPYYCWNRQGETPIKKQKIDMHIGKNIFGALSLKTGKVIYLTAKKKDGKAAAAFLEMVKEVKKKSYCKRGKILVLWDNVSCHKSQEVKEWLKKNPKQIELDNFPPYAPEMNPIEHVWKELKRSIAGLRVNKNLEEIMEKSKEYIETKRFHYKLFGMDKSRIFE